jgi:hypothetical protein
LFVGPKAKQAVGVQLISLADASVTTRRWTSWKPWAVVGAGVVVAGIGALLQRQSQADFDQFGREVEAQCSMVSCFREDLLGSTRDLESRARLENRIAISAFVTGGALLVGGLAAVILNRPRQIIPEQPRPNKPQVVPTVSANSAGLSLIGRF